MLAGEQKMSMTKRIILPLILFLLLPVLAQAQWRVAANLGGNYNWIFLRDYFRSSPGVPVNTYSGAFGIVAGVNGGYQFNRRFALMGELTWQTQAHKLPPVISNETFNHTYLSLTATGVWSPFKRLNFEAGIGTNYTVIDRLPGDRNPGLQALAGISIPYRRFELAARYYSALIPAATHTVIFDGDERNIYNNGVQLSLRYYLIK
jgi:hypothetical protein